MKDQRRFAPKGVRITPESVSGFTGISSFFIILLELVLKLAKFAYLPAPRPHFRTKPKFTEFVFHCFKLGFVVLKKL